MKVIQEISKVEVGQKIIRNVLADCHIHGQTNHLDINGNIDCYECNDAKIKIATTARMNTEEKSMRVIMLNKMKSKGVDVNMGRFYNWQYDEARNDEQRDKIAQLQQYSKSINSSSPNLIILGRTGTGKTMLANAIAVNHYLKKEQSLPSEFNIYNQQDFYTHTCELIISSNIGSQARARWGNHKATEDDYLRNLVANELLIIDDLGAYDRHMKDRERIAQLIDSRYNKAPTVITTNMDIKELREFLGDRTWDRLHQNLMVLECNWDSYRAKNASIRIVGSAK